MNGMGIRKILVVDDDEAMCSMVTSFLAMIGYYCQSATGPSQALAILEHEDYDLVISDIRMDGMDGLDLVRDIHRKYPVIDTIIISGFTGDYTYGDVIEAGAVDFISKPISLPEFEAKITRISRERKALAELRDAHEATKHSFAELKRANEALSSEIGEREKAEAELQDANYRLEAEIETRKKVEGALRESEQRFRWLFERHRATMFLTDPDSGAILDVNEAAAQFYGYSRPELCAMNIAEINQLPGSEIAQALRSILKSEINRFVFPHRLRTGEIRTVEVYSSPIEMGSRTVLFSIVHDITERKRAEDELAQMTKYLKNVFVSSPDGISIVDAHGKFIEWNRMAGEQLGYTFEELNGKSAFDLYVDKDRLNTMLTELRREGTIKKYEIDMKRKDGTIATFEISISLLRDDSNMVIGSVGVVRDLSDMKKALYALQTSHEQLHQEITVRQQAEAALRLRLSLLEFAATHSLEELLQKTLDEVGSLTNSPIGFFHFVESDGKTLSLQAWSTQTMEKFCKAEGKGLHYSIDQAGVWVDCVHEKRPVIHNDYQALSHRKGMPEGHSPVIRELVVPIVRSGRIVAILGIGNKPADYNDKDVEVVSYLADVAWEITERKRADAALKESRQELANIIDFLPDATYVINNEGKAIAWNKAMEELTGTKAPDILGKGNYEYALPFYGERRPVLIDFALNPQKNVESKYSTAEKRGEALTGGAYVELGKGKAWLQGTASVLRDSNGSIAGAICSMRDLTEAKKTREELRRTNVEMAQLLASIPSFLIGLTPEYRIIRWNRAAEKIFGIDGDGVTGRPIDECGIQWDWLKMSVAISSCRRDNASIRLDDVRFQRPDGKEGFLGVVVSSIEGKGAESSGILLQGNDITERRILESQLVQAQKLESIGQLAAGIAHEINTPAQYVGDNARFLLEAHHDLERVHALYDQLLKELRSGNAAEELVRKIEEAAEEIDLEYIRQEAPKAVRQSLEGIERISRIVLAMKQFSHPGTDAKTNIDLNKAIESTITVARNEWKYVAEMLTDFDPGLPFVPCLPAEINQVFLNMIINAGHAVADALKMSGSDSKGTITISTHALGEYAEIRISDTGTGIPENIRSKIFDPFFTTKEVGKGTGQGLAISRSVVVDKHGGTITFESEVGKGTCFIIRLPLNQNGSEK